MAVTLIQCRTQIQDQPKTFPSPQAGNMSPEVIGVADGVATVFYTQRQNLVANSLQVYTWSMPAAGGTPTYQIAVSSTYKITGDGQITFNASSIPANGKFVGAVYQATRFSDAEIQTYLDAANAQYTSDITVLSAVQFYMIPVILADRDKLALYRFGSYTEDPNGYANNLMKIRESLRKDLTGDPVPGKATPSLTIAGIAADVYQPQR